MNNQLENGCFGNVGNQKCLEMGCIPNSGIHTFEETCSGGDSPCPDKYHLEHNNGSINFNCPDAEAEAHCQATFGPGFHLAPCLEQGCVLTDDSTYQEWCKSPEEVFDDEIGIGGPNDPCPADCYLNHNYGTVNFHCPDLESEQMCHATFGPNFTLNECLSFGCVMTDDSTYQEWCEGGSCGYPDGTGTGGTGTGGTGTGGTGTGGTGGSPCPTGMTLQHNSGSINFECPDAEAEANCQATFGHYFHLSPCLELGCVMTADSTYAEWCEGSGNGTGGTGTGGTGTGGTGTDGGAMPVPGPNGCPSGFELHQSGTTIIFDCPDMDSESQCQNTYGPDFTMYTCLSLGCILGSDADFQEWCKPTTGNGPHQCQVGTYPHNNGGVLWFDCPDPTVMDQCRETFSSNDYSYMLAMCTSYGCVQSQGVRGIKNRVTENSSESNF